VQTVDGVAALILQGNYPGDCNPAPPEDGCAPAQQNPTALTTQIGGIDIDVYGAADWTTDQIVSVSNTI